MSVRVEDICSAGIFIFRGVFMEIRWWRGGGLVYVRGGGCFFTVFVSLKRTRSCCAGLTSTSVATPDEAVNQLVLKTLLHQRLVE